MAAIVKESRILVVDDSLLMRQMVRNILSGLGHTNIDEAANGLVASAKVEQAKKTGEMYGIILLDWAMPEMDGLTFLKRCRADGALDGIPIIMLTAVSEQSSMVEALREGAAAYVTKPFAAGKVAEALESVKVWVEKNGRH